MTPDRLKSLVHYNPDTGVFTRLTTTGNRSQWKAGTELRGAADQGYRRVMLDGRRYRAHRLAWLYMTGAWPAGEIDHINQCRSDNRWCNLRDVSLAENQHNRRLGKNNTSGYLGVAATPDGRWVARINASGERRYLGTFACPEEAGRAYRAAKSTLHPTAPMENF